MQFLPDVDVPCPECNGSRYAKEAWEIGYENKQGNRYSLPELMEMDVNTALQAIADLKVVHQRLEVLKNLPEHFSENVIKAGAMNRNSWKSKNIIVLRYCWDSMWQSRFFCTILRETCQKPERWQTAHDKTGFQKSWTGASEY